MQAKRRNQRSAHPNCNRPRAAPASRSRPNRDGDFEVWVMNADGTNPINLTRNTPDAALDDLESLAIATVDPIRAGDVTLDVVDGWVMPTLAEDGPGVPVPLW